MLSLNNTGIIHSWKKKTMSFTKDILELFFQPDSRDTTLASSFMKRDTSDRVSTNFKVIRYVRNYSEWGDILSNGGITFYIEADPANGKLQFSMARCSTDNEIFNKQYATELCLTRFREGEYYELEGYNLDINLVTNIYLALKRETCPNYIENFKGINVPKLTKIPETGNKGNSLKIHVSFIERNYLPNDMNSLKCMGLARFYRGKCE